jgi:hypothetical protein
LATRHFVPHATVTAQTQRGIKAAAEAELITPSAWLRRVVIRALASQPRVLERRESDEVSADPRDRRLFDHMSADSRVTAVGPQDVVRDRQVSERQKCGPTFAGLSVEQHLPRESPC